MRLAAQGLRETEQGTEAIVDLDVVERVKRQAREVHVKAFAAGAVLTAAALLIPG